MNDFNLPKLIQALRLNVSYMSRLIMLILVAQFCLIVFVWLSIAGSYPQIAIATAAVASIAFLLCVYSFAKMVRADLATPEG